MGILIAYVWEPCVHSAHGVQKKASELEMSCELPYGCWELKTGLLKKGQCFSC